jgi:D-threonate/D-erythronate kinase
MAVTIIADDLTGACDTGALFAGQGPVGVFVAPALPGPEVGAAALDIETRALSAPEAAAAMRRLTAATGARLSLVDHAVFKKIDSTFRGPIAAELDALVEGVGARAALVCPAFPAQGRTVVHGLLSVHGVPAHESAIGLDPHYPGGMSDVVDILARHSSLPVSLLPLKEVRGAQEDLGRALRERHGLVAADAETNEDLDTLARAALGHLGIILVGSAGLASAAARAWGHATPVPPMPVPGAWLIVAGSQHPTTRAQIRGLEDSGVVGLRVDGPREPILDRVIGAIRAGRPAFLSSGDALDGAREQVARRLASAARAVLSESTPSLVVLSGGETALAVMRALGARHLEIDGAPATGLALGRLIAAGRPPLPLLTKAGGFASPGLFAALKGFM